jgi:group I intron endonuclease
VKQISLYTAVLGSVVPAASYGNLYNNRAQWRLDHRGAGKVSCIYMLVNLQNPMHVYVGQTQNLLGRMSNYLNIAFLKAAANRNMPISRALLKYGSDNFALVILEYVSKEDLDAAERRWIATLKPYYNINSGGSSAGTPHSDETKKILREQKLGTKLSDDTKKRISMATTGILNPFFGATHTAATLLVLAMANSAGVVYLYSAQNVLLTVLPSLKTLAKLIMSNHETLKNNMDTGVLFRGGWYIRSTPFNYVEIPLYTDFRSNEAAYIYADMLRDAKLRKPVFLFNANTKAFIVRHDTVSGAARAIGCHHNAVTAAIKINGVINGYIVSGHRLLL